MGPRIDGYRLDRLVGRGATGEVWLAWDEGLADRPVAVKRIRAGCAAQAGGAQVSATSRVAALTDEAQVVASLDHPNILRVIDVVADGDGVAVVLPFARGGSMRDLLDERGTLGAGAVVALLGPVASALVSMHRAGIVHGDLKPANLLLTSDGAPMVADFGAATMARPEAGPAGSPEPARSGGGVGQVWGATPAYVDPAVTNGRPADARSDVYSLGVIAYEALCGRLPHRGEPAQLLALAAAGVHRHLGTWPGIDVETADAVEWALAADPEDRPPDAHAFSEALAASVDDRSVALPGPARYAHQAVRPPAHETVAFGPGPSPAAPNPPSARHRVVRIFAALAVVVVAIVAMLGLAAAGSTRPSGCTGHRATADACPSPPLPDRPGRRGPPG